MLLNTCTYILGGSEVKASACNVGDLGSIPGSGRFPGEGNGNPLQYSCLENPMDGGAWWATVHGVAKSRTRLSDFTHSLYLQWVALKFVMGGEASSFKATRKRQKHGEHLMQKRFFGPGLDAASITSAHVLWARLCSVHP